MLNATEPELLRIAEPLNADWRRRARLHLAWFAALPALPVVALQGRSVRRKIGRLPDADGATTGFAECKESGQRPLRILTLGESTVAGVGAATHETGVTGCLARALRDHLGRSVEWRAIGKNGATARTVNRRLLPMIEERDLDAIFVLLGASDTFRLTSLKQWRTEVLRLADALLDLGTKQVLFSQVPPVGKFTAFPLAFRLVLGAHADLLGAELVRSLRGKPNVHFCPIGFPSGRLAPDGVHPSEAGYATWGAQLATYIDEQRATESPA